MKLLRLTLVAGLVLAMPTVVLAQIGQVNGTVLGANRKGITGASVALIPKTGRVIYGTSTGGDGRYAFKGLGADVYSVVVILPEGGVARKDGIRVRALFRSIVDFNLVSDLVNATLPPLPASEQADPNAAFSFSATLSGPDRQPSPDAAVSLIPVDGDGIMQRCLTKVEGTCVMREVPDGTYRISARAPGFMTWTLGPIAFKDSGDMGFTLALVNFPMGFRGGFEDLLVPTEPIPPDDTP